MRIGYLGPHGTYTEEAAQSFMERLHLTNANLLPLHSIEAVFSTLNSKGIDAGVVPLTNTIHGDYSETVVCLAQRKLRQRSLELHIALSFGVHPHSSLSMIQEIRSKDTVFSQCSSYLNRFYPKAMRIAVNSTATAMNEIIKQNLLDVAAIGSKKGMRFYGLKILNDNIGNRKDNFTTFLYLENQ